MKAEVGPCPRCGSRDVEYNDRRGALNGAIGVIVIGILLAFAYAPVIIIVALGGGYLVFSALRTQPHYFCRGCRHRWPANQTGPDGGE